MAKSQKETRSRSWVFVVYPESAPKDWRTILDKQGMTWVESPLHNKDVNPDGEVKKEHWHVLLMFQTLKSYGQMQEIAHELKSPNPQKCMNIHGMVRYFAHLDNPEKYQYPVNEIKAHGGADIAKYLTANGVEKLRAISEMQEWIEENNCTELTQLADYALKERFDDWYEVLATQSTVFLNAYIRSMRHQKRR